MMKIRHLTQDAHTDPSYHLVKGSKFIISVRSNQNDQFPSVELHINGKAGIVYELCNAYQTSHVFYSNSPHIEDHLENNYHTPQVQVTLTELALVSQVNALREERLTVALHGVKNHGKSGDIELRLKADASHTDENGVEYTRIYSLALLMTPMYIPEALLMKLVPVQRNMMFFRIGPYFLILRTQRTAHLYPSVLLYDEQSKPKMIYRLYKSWETYAKQNQISIPSLPVYVLDELCLITQAKKLKDGTAQLQFNRATRDSKSDRIEMHIRLVSDEEEVFGLRMLLDPVPTYVNDGNHS